MGIAPEVWYNDAGGVTVGLRSRTDYLGRFDQNILSITGGTGWGADDPVYRVRRLRADQESDRPARRPT